MFAQFRAQYPQGRIQTEMLPKIDGLHAFRAIVSEGDAIMGTATAVDSDLEIAEDRAVKRALAIAGLAFDNGFDNNYGNYGGRSPILTQVSREASTMNSLPSANFNTLSSLGASNLSSTSDSLPVTHTTQAIHAESAIDYTSEYGDNDHLPTAEVDLSPLPQTTQTTPSKSSPPQISPEPVDLSDAISKIDVEMERLSWKKTQGRDYLVRTFGKKSRQQLTNDELLQFLSHLKSLPTPYSQLENDDFF
ncbi:MAG: hypothetical protein ACKO7R_12635 [Pseudanabaena sp.]